ncbi:MAG: zf-HC2 domain-containing protein [bacterium]|nr:zf-HC2 domain-containing protein [bacterium]MCM1376291.1 zf-HC2 domain-containing protein [Muribaculum sp.]
MSKLNCEIIKDLIPSYLDGICTPSSREAVEEHMAECAQCRDSLELLRNTEIEETRLNQSELNHLKKIKWHMMRKSMLIVGGLAALFILLGDALDFPLWCNDNLYYVAFPLIALGFYGMLAEYQTKIATSRWRVCLGAVSATGIFYCVVLLLLFLRSNRTMTLPFGIDMPQWGHFVYVQLIGIIIVELLIFMWFVADCIKREHSLGILHLVSLSGIFLSMVIRVGLHDMADPATFQNAMLKRLGIILVEALAIAVLELGIGRFISARYMKKRSMEQI